MGIVIKNVGGDEYTYVLAGKKQFFLGRKDDVGNFNQENLLKALNEFGKTYDKQTKRYIESVLSCIKYIDKKTGVMYINKRKLKMVENATKIQYFK